MKKLPIVILLAAYTVFVVLSLLTGFEPGVRTADSLLLFLGEMVRIVPAAFILIGLFEVWVPRAVVEHHLGHGSGLKSYFWAFALAGTSVGGIYLSYPVAAALRGKGARLGVVLSYIGLSGICRVPMTLFEISFLGVEFTLIRYLVGVPLIVLASDRLGSLLEKRGYEFQSDE